jgi:hypothetical protein
MTVLSSLSSAWSTEWAEATRASTCTSKLSCSATPPMAISFCRTLCSRAIRNASLA